jgi:hypothetical protein
MGNTQTKESGHWYKKDGTPAYTMIGKNGAERNTTLRDARKENLVPSVTSIIRCAAAPGLENWKSQQVLMAALTTDRKPEESEQEYISRIITDANEQALKAREKGTLIHAFVQSGFEGVPLEAEAYRYYLSAKNTLENELNADVEWICEKSFATERYGGKADLHSPHYLIDFKTTDKPVEGLKLWDEHYYQLAAYRAGLGINGSVCGILYINSNTAESRLILAEEKELEKGLRCFNALVDFYYSKTRLGEE